MADRLISIIIPKQQEQTYLIRCLNAIKRQTYQNYEIILITEQCEEKLQEQYNLKIVETEGTDKWIGMQQAIESACGEYIYFCSMSSVLAPNTLEELLNDTLDADEHSMGQVMILDGKNVKRTDASVVELGIYGKFFLKSRIQEEKIEFQEKMEFADYIFASVYERKCEKIEENKDVYIYETDKKFFYDTERLISGMEEERELLLVAQEDARYFKKILALLENTIAREIERYRIPQYTNGLVEAFPKEYEINYQFAKKYLKKVFDSCQKENDEETFKEFQTYFRMLESEEDFFKILLPVFELSEDKYGYLKECSLKEYLFFRDRINDEKKQQEEDYQRLTESVKKLEKASAIMDDLQRIAMEMDSVQKNMLVTNVKTAETVTEELTGPMLAEFVVDKYRSGGLGLKTLLLSLKVWIMYKFRKGR